MVQNSTGKRGRPRAYDPERALTEATDLFWAQGFSGTSLDELSAATKMNRPSLYGAFGDKRALYHATLRRYRLEIGANLARLMETDEPLRDCLGHLYGYALDLYIPETGKPRGCFVISIGVPEAQGDPETLKIVSRAFQAFEKLFERRFRAAIEDGELPVDTDCAMHAKLALSIVFFLSIRSRSGESRATLERFAAFSIDRLVDPRAPGAPL
jgi:TetR/AcrR family transcriptional regulator, copper-responsive repressor